MYKRLWVVALCLLLALSAAPVFTYAQETSQEPEPNEALLSQESYRLTLDREEIVLTIGEEESASLSAELVPAMQDGNVIVYQWSSTDPEIAMVTDMGAISTVTALRGGRTRVVVEVTDSVRKFLWRTECEVTVHEPVRGIILSTGLLTLRADDPEQAIGKLSHAVQPATHTGSIAWRVEQDEEQGGVIAYDAESGTVQALRGGEADVVAEAENGVSARCKVLVLADSSLPLSSARAEGIVQETEQPSSAAGGRLQGPERSVRFGSWGTAVGIRLGSEPVAVRKDLEIADKSLTDGQLAWRSDAKRVARVDEQGVVYPVGVGKATITARTPDGEEASSFVNGAIIPVDGGFTAYSGV